MDNLLKLERNVRSIYARTLSLLASRYRFSLPVSDKDVPGSPRVLFLGNHSSGKSSFINYIAGADIQESGTAPTDDGFTLVTYGEEEETLDGQTLASHPELDYQELASLGPEFLAKLCFKTYPSENLRQLTLIDSPGMIDSASSHQLRSYDFRECIRRFAESADLILFFFDPDKPGTTGEAISIFTSELVGIDHKLLIVLNKVDLFDNIRDFARTYGTLCWNLSKTIPTKDTPRIYTTYLPGFATRPLEENAKPIPLEDFDISRDEVVSEIMRAPARRADNLVSGLLSHAHRLSVHVKVCLEVVSAYRRLVNRLWLGFSAILLVSVGAGGSIRSGPRRCANKSGKRCPNPVFSSPLFLSVPRCFGGFSLLACAICDVPSRQRRGLMCFSNAPTRTSFPLKRERTSTQLGKASSPGFLMS